uniref:Synaptogyrin n=1 Tax=Romanomermis culicivorax TaxID=13658 RepID=A0A915IKX9_ROMCU
MDKISGAYGGGLSGTNFDPIAFVKRPQVILRIVSWFFALLVFWCISSGGWISKDRQDVCVFSGSSGTCSFGTFVGVVAFLTCSVMLVIEFRFDKISSVQIRKRVVIGDLAACGIFVFFWFINFCVLTNKWVNRSAELGVFNKNPPQAAVTFSFLSILTWIDGQIGNLRIFSKWAAVYLLRRTIRERRLGITLAYDILKAGLLFMAFRRYKEGVATSFAPSYDQDFGVSGAGAAPFYPGVGGMDSYQEPPFSASNDSAMPPQYQQPAY